MGSGIAQVAAQSGFPTAILEATPAFVDAGMKRITKFLDGGVAKGKVTPADRDATLGRLTAGTDPAALAGCDLVIEAITENLGAKREIFADSSRLGPDASRRATPVALDHRDGGATARPTRFVGCTS
jgi:3-hydroxybutyryl-CoA dehydrogenase